MTKRCCIKGCKSKEQTMHRFPNPRKDLELFHTWARVLQINTEDPLKTYASKRVCFAHFKSTCKSPGHKILHRYAVPTIGIPEAQDELSSYSATDMAVASIYEVETENLEENYIPQ